MNNESKKKESILRNNAVQTIIASLLCIVIGLLIGYLVLLIINYSACEIFAKAGAIQPVLNIADKLEGDNQLFYSIYDNGAKAAMGNFATFTPIPGIEVRGVFFDPVNSLVSGSMTEDDWIASVKSASEQMRVNLQS